jgi:hypothetical protein
MAQAMARHGRFDPRNANRLGRYRFAHIVDVSDVVRLSTTRPALIVVATSRRGHPLRGRAGPRATSFRLLSCLPTALRCQMDGTGTSVRHRFGATYGVGQDLTDDLAISPPSLAQEPRDLTFQSIAVQQLAHGVGVIRKFPLQLCRQHVSLHDQRRPQASQDMLLFRQSRFAGLWQRH